MRPLIREDEKESVGRRHVVLITAGLIFIALFLWFGSYSARWLLGL